MQVKARYRYDLWGAGILAGHQEANCCGIARWPTKGQAGMPALPANRILQKFRIPSVPDWLLKLIEVTLVRFEL